jgi:hypothetical protein
VRTRRDIGWTNKRGGGGKGVESGAAGMAMGPGVGGRCIHEMYVGIDEEHAGPWVSA